jgi:manganese/iron transport system permease protein
MQHALLAAALLGLTCAVFGVYVVQRRMACIGDALAHTTLPGLVVAYLFGWSLSLGGMAATLEPHRFERFAADRTAI